MLHTGERQSVEPPANCRSTATNAVCSLQPAATADETGLFPDSNIPGEAGANESHQLMLRSTDSRPEHSTGSDIPVRQAQPDRNKQEPKIQLTEGNAGENRFNRPQGDDPEEPEPSRVKKSRPPADLRLRYHRRFRGVKRIPLPCTVFRRRAALKFGSCRRVPASSCCGTGGSGQCPGPQTLCKIPLAVEGPPGPATGSRG